MTKQTSSQITQLTILSILVGIGWVLALFWVSPDQQQGEVYRILYLHVPTAFAAFLAAAVLCWYSVRALWKNDQSALLTQKAAVEVGLIFTILTLATGSIWAKPTWGTWWTWDARLTTTLILAILYVTYLIFFALRPVLFWE